MITREEFIASMCISNKTIKEFCDFNRLDFSKIPPSLLSRSVSNSVGYMNKSCMISKYIAREQLRDFGKLVKFSNNITHGVGQRRVKIDSNCSGISKPEWRFIKTVREQIKPLLATASRLKASNINLKNTRFDPYTLRLEINPKTHTASIVYAPKSKNSLSLVHEFKSQMSEAFKYMDVVLCIQAHVVAGNSVVNPRCDIKVFFKDNFLNSTPEKPKEEPEKDYGEVTSVANKDWFNPSNMSMWSINAPTYSIKPIAPKPIEEWHAEIIEKSLQAIDDEIVKVSFEVNEAKKTLESAQVRAENLTKQRMKLKNALFALK